MFATTGENLSIIKYSRWDGEDLEVDEMMPMLQHNDTPHEVATTIHTETESDEEDLMIPGSHTGDLMLPGSHTGDLMMLPGSLSSSHTNDTLIQQTHQNHNQNNGQNSVFS